MLVAVGSLNPVKIEATRLGFESVWPDKVHEFKGISVPSGVSDQPMSEDEALEGATTRSKSALIELDAEFGVGLEGGLYEFNGKWYEVGWIVVTHKNGLMTQASTVRMQVPDKMIEMIKSGKELGDVVDIIFNGNNLKQAEGFVGRMTNNAITRTSISRDAVAAALGVHANPEIY